MSDRTPFSWKFTAPLYMGSTLNPINSSMIATALVPIAAYLHIPVSQTTLLVTALYLASSIAQPTAGKLSEVFGPRRVFLAGIVLVLLGGLTGGMGQNLIALAVSRILIGIGTSTAYPSAMLLIRRRAEAAGMSKPPGNVLGALQIAGVSTSVEGLPLGGVLVAAWGWRTTFLINIPFALTALYMAARWIPRDESLKGELNFRRIATRIDLAGIIGFAAAITSLLFFCFHCRIHPGLLSYWLLHLAVLSSGKSCAWSILLLTYACLRRILPLPEPTCASRH
ncbi:MFS transporter [Paenibacillus cremeus]|uniref:MFS transporter n=1 Tax=Paenibacillus cremeus TaxID=2163881 RepID=UPI001C94F120|nr:MFS transporter [Paenibacillus cremeus]